MDMILGEVFTTMDIDVDGDQGAESDTEARTDRLAKAEGRWTGQILLSLEQTLVQPR